MQLDDQYPTIFDYDSEDNFSSFSPFDLGMYEEMLYTPEDFEPPSPHNNPDSPCSTYSPPHSPQGELQTTLPPTDCPFPNYPDSPCSSTYSPPHSPPHSPQGSLQGTFPYTVQHVQVQHVTLEMKVVLFSSPPQSTQTIPIPPWVTFSILPESEPESQPEFTQIILDPNRSDDPHMDYFIQMKSLPFDVSKQLTDSKYNKLFKLHRKQLLLNSHPVMTERDLEDVRSCGFVYFLRNVKTIVPKIGPWKFHCHTRNTEGDRSFNIPGMAITCKVKEWLSDDGLWRLYHYKAGKRLGAQ